MRLRKQIADEGFLDFLAASRACVAASLLIVFSLSGSDSIRLTFYYICNTL